jgi:hypothetical protein
MNNGQLFCDLAYAALSREELELAELAEQNADDALSVVCIGELPIVFLIRKEALRRKIHLVGEHPYGDGRDKVDLCLLDGTYQPLASFEAKVASADPRQRYWRDVRTDVSKHFDTARGIREACSSHERYNALFLVTNDDDSKEVIETKIMNEIGDLIQSTRFLMSDSIKLNPVKSTNPFADTWNFMRVVVFSGELIGRVAQGAPAS